MSQAPALQQKQTATLTLTPQLRQAIKILELTNLELSEYLAQEVLDNPLLDIEEKSLDTEKPPRDEEVSLVEKTELSELCAPDYENLWTNESEADRWAHAKGGSFTHEGADDASTRVACVSSLRDHLLSQLYTDVAQENDRIIGMQLIESLDEEGYLRMPLETIAGALNQPLESIENVLKRLQEFDPPGIFARNLLECLTLQLKDQGKMTPKITRFLAHLDLFEAGKMEMMLKVARLTQEDALECLRLLKQLDPKPGNSFEKMAQDVVIPDVFVSFHESSQKWRIHLNETTLPRIFINSAYYAQVGSDGNKEVKTYLSERLSAANWLLKALDQRAQTILKVTSEIVACQAQFLQYGPQYLRPLTLKDVALAIDMHESTVSRVTQNKFMSTPRGMFELKSFFSNVIAGMQEDTYHSGVSAQSVLTQLIQEEDPDAPLSDDQLVQKMAEAGVDVARRTISKYRTLMNIPSSYERRRQHLRRFGTR